MLATYEIYINGELVDIESDFEIPLTFQVFDLITGDASMSDYSKIVMFPLTDKNAKIFGFPDTLESISTTPKTKLTLTAIKNGIEIVSNGWCTVESVNEGKIECTLFFRNYNFYKTIEDKTLQDLDLSALDHDWTSTAINVHIDTPSLADLIYVPIEYGEYSLAWLDPDRLGDETYSELTGIIDYQCMIPAIKVSYLMDKILEEAGYDGINFSTSDMPAPYNYMYIPLISIFPNRDTELQAGTFEFELSADYSDWDAFYTIKANTLFEDGFAALLFDTENENFANQGRVVDHSLIPNENYTVYRVGCNGRYIFTTNVIFKDINIPIGGSIQGRIAICAAPSTDYFIELEGNYEPNFEELDSEDFQIDAAVDELTVSVNASAYLTAGTFVMVMFIRTLADTGGIEAIVKAGSNFSVLTPDLETTGYGYRIPIAANLPDTKQKDFIKGILGFFGAVITSKMYSSELTLRYLRDCFNNAIARDWSKKLDLSTKPKIIHRLDTLAKKNNFVYLPWDDASDDWLDSPFTYNSFFELVNADLLEKELDFLKLPFSPSRMVERVRSGFEVPQIRLFAKDYTSLAKPTARIVLVDLFTTSEEISYKSSADSYEKFVTGSHQELRAFFLLDGFAEYSVLAEGHTLDLTEYVQAHYQELIDVYENFKMIECGINLAETDIADFNHFVSVWIDKYKAYFYVNRINDYTDGITNCELIKL